MNTMVERECQLCVIWGNHTVHSFGEYSLARSGDLPADPASLCVARRQQPVSRTCQPGPSRTGGTRGI